MAERQGGPFNRATSEIVPAGGISARPRIKQPMVGLNGWP